MLYGRAVHKNGHHPPMETGDRKLSLICRAYERNRMNGKQILSESCKQAVRRTATPTMPNKWAAPRAGRGPGMRTRGQAQKERGPALGAGPLLAKTPPVGQRRPGLPRAGPAVQSALGGLTSGFGMGPGVPPLPWPLAVWGRSASGSCPPGPGGRTARASKTPRDRPWEGHAEELGRLVPLG